MGEVAEEHIVEVAFLETIHRERKVIHEAKVVVCWPDQVHTIDQSIETNNSNSNIAIRQFP